jgi:Enoyl-(Acyl carrier protein) reductase
VARHVDELNKVRDQVRKIAPKIERVVIDADVSRPRDIARIVASTLAQFKGHLDVLVNNASTTSAWKGSNLRVCARRRERSEFVEPGESIIAIGNPTPGAMTTKRTAELGNSKNGKTCVVSCVRNHATTPYATAAR